MQMTFFQGKFAMEMVVGILFSYELMLFNTKVEITVGGATDIIIITISIGINVVFMSAHSIFTIFFGAVLFCHTLFRPNYQCACVKPKQH